MFDHLLVSVVAAVVKIRRTEIGVDQRRGFERAAGPDIVHLVVDKVGGRLMTGRTTHGRVVPERLVEQRFAAVRSRRRRAGKPAVGSKFRIGQERYIFNVGDECIKNFVRRLGAGKFVDDDVAHEVSQRREASVMAVGRQVFGAAQARRCYRIENAIVRLGLEQCSGRIERAGPAGQAGDE